MGRNTKSSRRRKPLKPTPHANKKEVEPDLEEGVVVSELEVRIAIKVGWFAAGKPKMTDAAEAAEVVKIIHQTLAPRVVADSKSGKRTVRDVCRQCAVCDSIRKNYTGARKKGSGGHNKKMDVADCATDNSMAIAVAALNRGASLARAVNRCNQYRTRHGQEKMWRRLSAYGLGSVPGLSI